MRTSRWRRVIGLTAFALILAGGIVFALWPSPVPVDLAAVTHGPLRETVDGEGRTRVKEVYTVSAPLAGRIQRIEVHVGDPVTAQQTVLMAFMPMDPSFLDIRTAAQAAAQVKAAEAAKQLAEAELQRARAELEFARTDRDRVERLAERGVAAERERERARLDFQTRQAAQASAEATLRVRTSELELARAALIVPTEELGSGASRASCCINIRAPVSGRVLQVLRESEGIVQQGTPLIDIGDPRDIEIVVDLLSTDAVKAKPGDAVVIEGWGGPPLSGRVRHVEPFGFTKVSALGIEEQRVNVIIDFAEPAERYAQLGHGYRVDARVVVWESSDVLKLPIGALFRDGDKWAVFAAEGGRARLRHVALGHVTALAAEMLDGLPEGASVVLHPSDQVRDGTRIIPRGPA